MDSDSPRHIKNNTVGFYTSGKIMYRVSPKRGGWITKHTGISFWTKEDSCAILPYATYRHGTTYLHIAAKDIGPGRDFEPVD